METDYRKMPRAVHRDNKEAYNVKTKGWSDSCGYKMRVPSLKRNKKTWENFYKLYPWIKEHLISMGEQHVGRYSGKVTLDGNVYTVKDVRIHGGCFKLHGPDYRIRTTKYLKIW